MGIADFALALPSAKATVDDFLAHPSVTRSKVQTVIPSGQLSVLAPGETPWGLGVEAARNLIDSNLIDPRSIAWVIYAGSADWGQSFWSPAVKIAAELGIEHATCFEVSNFCNAGFFALTLAEDLIRRTPGQLGLVIVADRLSQLVDRSSDLVELFNFADAASAVLLSDAAVRYHIVGSATRTDPTWADSYYGITSGTTIDIHRGPKPDGLAEAFTHNFVALTHQALAQAGIAIDHVSHFLVTHGNRDLHCAYLDALGVSQDRSVFNYSSDGHLGGCDPLFALRQLEIAKTITPGDTIVVATAGSGFTWGITVLQATETSRR